MQHFSAVGKQGSTLVELRQFSTARSDLRQANPPFLLSLTIWIFCRLVTALEQLQGGTLLKRRTVRTLSHPAIGRPGIFALAVGQLGLLRHVVAVRPLKPNHVVFCGLGAIRAVYLGIAGRLVRLASYKDTAKSPIMKPHATSCEYARMQKIDCLGRH